MILHSNIYLQKQEIVINTYQPKINLLTGNLLTNFKVIYKN